MASKIPIRKITSFLNVRTGFPTLRKCCKKIPLNVNYGLRRIKKRSRDLEIQIAPRILEARHRRQQYIKNVAERAQKSRHSRTEVIGLEEVLEMRRGKSDCLVKMDGQQILPRGSIKRQCTNLSFTRQIMIESRRNYLLIYHNINHFIMHYTQKSCV